VVSPGILQGLRVVEHSAYVAAPLAGTTLASLGADVIRIEQRGGGIDAMRWPVHDGRSLYRAGLDQGKRLVGLDLRSDRGQQIASKLIASGGAGGGILLTNLGTKGWMAFESLVRLRPDLIMVQITGWPDGRPAVDYTVNAALGFPLVTGPASWEGPVNHVLPAWDVATGLSAALAILAAERHRRQGGAGQLIRISLADVAAGVAANLGFLAEAQLVDEPRGRFGNYVYGTFGRDFRTKDGRYVMVCALTPRQWQDLVSATELSGEISALEAAAGADFDDEAARIAHRAEIAGLIERWVTERTLAEVLRVFDGNGVLWAPYRTFKEAFEKAPVRPPERDVGADTEATLTSELGLDSDQIGELRAQGVIA
jgi:2-methylfumaryl-CoA isomerase